MSKPYEKLLGNRVYLKMNMPTFNLEIPESTKNKIIQEAAQKMEKAEVYDIGTTVTNVGVGDVVMVGKEGIIRGELVNLEKGLVVMMINPLEIVQIWSYAPPALKPA